MNAQERALATRGDVAGLRALAERQEAARRRAKAARRKRPPRAVHRPTKAERAAASAAETARIRVACDARANGIGELCGRALDPERSELCHLDGGSGKRREKQSVSNCLMEHHECHQGPGGLDKTPRAWIPEVKAWAARHGYAVPERFRKLEALAAVPVTPRSQT